MTTRFNAKDAINYNVEGIKSGYDGLRSDLSIPSCGIEDVDVSLFNLFDKEISPSVGGKDTAELKKVPVVFAAGEKWALLKKGKPIRDKTNTLILPLITIMRSEISQGPEDYAGRGINQQTGEIVVKRRLDSSDRNYQNLINKHLILNQTNVAVTGSIGTVLNQITTSRKTGEREKSASTRSGALLLPSNRNNVFETIVVPAPQFYTAGYQITIWTQYTQHMNQILEKIMSSFLPQAQSWKLLTPKGYWFVATVEGGNFAIETNFDDMSSAERFIKCNFMVKVPAYVWASSAPGVPVPVKRYISSPIIEFSVSKDDGAVAGSQEYSNNYVIGSDDPTLPLDEQANARSDQRKPGWRRQVIQPSNAQEKIDPNDPTYSSLPRGRTTNLYKKVVQDKVVMGGETKYVNVVSKNPTTGETVYTASNFEGLKIIVSDDPTE